MLVFPVPFYYSIILIASLAFFSCKHCTLPTILEIGKFNNQLLHLPLYQFAEHVLWETLLPRGGGGGGGGAKKNPFPGGGGGGGGGSNEKSVLQGMDCININSFPTGKFIYTNSPGLCLLTLRWGGDSARDRVSRF